MIHMRSSTPRAILLLLLLLAPLALASSVVTLAAPATATTKCGPTTSRADSTGLFHSASASVVGQLGGNSTSGPTSSHADAYGTGIGSSATADGDSGLWKAHSECSFPEAAPPTTSLPSIGCEEADLGLQISDVVYDGAVYRSRGTGTTWWVGTASRDGSTQPAAFPAQDGIVFSRAATPFQAPQGLDATGLHVLAVFERSGSLFSCSAHALYVGGPA